MGACLPGFVCDETKHCVPGDGGISGTGGGRVGGVDAGPRTETNCADGLDDDGDGKKDCADSDCLSRLCTDADPCTVGESCTAAGVCGNGTRNPCNAPGPCETGTGTCQAATGKCVYAPLAQGTSCDITAASKRCCNGECVDITLNANNCGGCGLACGGTACQSISLSACNAEPVDVSGRCSCDGGVGVQQCPMGQLCVGGACSPSSTGECAFGQAVDTIGTCNAYCRYP